MKVVIADGHPVMRLGLKGLLLATEARVVGETGCGEETLGIVERTAPDLVVLGLNLVEEMDGVEACRRIKALPTPRASWSTPPTTSPRTSPRASWQAPTPSCTKAPAAGGSWTQ